MRARSTRDEIEARRAGEASRQAVYNVSVDKYANESPRSLRGVPPMMATTVAPRHPWSPEETKHYQFKDRVAGGDALPLELTQQDREVMYFLDQFAKGHIETANQCVANGVDKNSVDTHGNGAVHYAARAGNIPMVEFAVKGLNINVNLKNKGGMTPLHLAVVQAAPQAPGGRITSMLQWLIIQGADPTVQSAHGFSPGVLAGNVGASLVAEWLEMCTSVPRWGPSEETLSPGGRYGGTPRAHMHGYPHTTGSKLGNIPTRY